MTNITTIGLDWAKSAFQVHCADRDGQPVMRKKLRRAQVVEFFRKLPPCLVAMELVRVRIIGHVHYRISATRCD